MRSGGNDDRVIGEHVYLRSESHSGADKVTVGSCLSTITAPPASRLATRCCRPRVGRKVPGFVGRGLITTRRRQVASGGGATNKVSTREIGREFRVAYNCQ
jgi:hypothetical protein